MRSTGEATMRSAMYTFVFVLTVAASVSGAAMQDNRLKTVARLEIGAIGGAPVGPDGYVVDSLYENQGLDVMIAAYGLDDEDAEVWLLGKSSDQGAYQLYGPGTKQTLDGK